MLRAALTDGEAGMEDVPDTPVDLGPFKQAMKDGAPPMQGEKEPSNYKYAYRRDTGRRVRMHKSQVQRQLLLKKLPDGSPLFSISPVTVQKAEGGFWCRFHKNNPADLPPGMPKLCDMTNALMTKVEAEEHEAVYHKTGFGVLKAMEERERQDRRDDIQEELLREMIAQRKGEPEPVGTAPAKNDGSDPETRETVG